MRIGACNSNIWQLWNGFSIGDGKELVFKKPTLKATFALAMTQPHAFSSCANVWLSAQELSMIWKECCEFWQLRVEVLEWEE